MSDTAIPLPPTMAAENGAMPPQSFLCELCNEEELNGMQTLPCRICRKRLHKECLIKEARYSKLEAQLVERSADKIGWSCNSCENTYKLLTNEERLSLNWNFDNFHVKKGLPIDELEYLRFIRERHNDRHLVPLSKKKEDMQIILFRRLDMLQVGQVDYWEFLKHESAKILELRNERDLVKMLQPDELTAAHNMFEAINRELGTPDDYMEARTAYRRWYKDKGKMEQIKEHEKSMIARKRMLRDSIQYDSKIPALETKAFNFSEDFPDEFPDAREDFADAADYDFSRYIKSVKGDSPAPIPAQPPAAATAAAAAAKPYGYPDSQFAGVDDSSNQYFQGGDNQGDRLLGGDESGAEGPIPAEVTAEEGAMPAEEGEAMPMESPIPPPPPPLPLDPMVGPVKEEVRTMETPVKEESPIYDEGKLDGTSTRVDDYNEDMSGAMTPEYPDADANQMDEYLLEELKASGALTAETAKFYNIYGGEARPADWKTLFKAEWAGESPVPSPPIVNMRVGPAYDDREKYNYRTRGITDEYTPSYQDIKIKQKERFMAERLAQEQREIEMERQQHAKSARDMRDKSRVVKIVTSKGDQSRGMVCEDLPPIQQTPAPMMRGQSLFMPQPSVRSHPMTQSSARTLPMTQASVKTLPMQPRSFTPLQQQPAMPTGPSYAPVSETQVLPPLKSPVYAAPIAQIQKVVAAEEEPIEALPPLPLSTSPIPILPRDTSAQVSQQALFDHRMKSVSRARALATEKLRQDQLDREAQEMQRAKAWEEFWNNQTLDLLNAQTTEEITEPGVYSHEVSGAVSRTIPGMSAQPAAATSVLCDDGDPRTRSEMSQTEETGRYTTERPATVADVVQSSASQPAAAVEAAVDVADNEPITTSKDSIEEEQYDRYIEKMIQQSQSGTTWQGRSSEENVETDIPTEPEPEPEPEVAEPEVTEPELAEPEVAEPAPMDEAPVAVVAEEEPAVEAENVCTAEFAFDDGQIDAPIQEDAKSSMPEDAAVKATVDQTDLVSQEETQEDTLESWRKRQSHPEEAPILVAIGEANREEIPPPNGNRQRPSTANQQAQTEDMDCEEVMADIRARRAAEEARIRAEEEAEQQRKEKEYLDKLKADAEEVEAARQARMRAEKEHADQIEAECQRALKERADRIRAEEEAAAQAKDEILKAEAEARERVEKLSIATSKAHSEALEQSRVARRRSEMAEKARAQAAAKVAAAAAAKTRVEAMERARWAEATRTAEMAAQAEKDALIVKAAKMAREAELAARNAAENAANAEKTQAWRNFLESQAGFIIASRTNLLGEPQTDCTQPTEDIGIPRVVQRNR